MAEQRTIKVNGKDAQYAVVTEGGAVFYSADVLLALGALVQVADPITVDTLPIATIGNTAKNKVKVTTFAGSPELAGSDRPVTIADTDSAGNVLNLAGEMENGVLKGLNGSLTFHGKDVTASIDVKLAAGQLAGDVSVQTGALTVTLEAGPGAVSGTLAYNTPDCKLSLAYKQGKDKPTALSLSLTVRF